MLKRICAYLCIFIGMTASATPPVLWGPNSRTQVYSPQGITLQSTVTVDNDGLNNFVKAQGAETDVQVAAWSTYADAAASSPADCTGGAANITWTRNTTSPLRGAADFKLTKDAANRQGQGVAYAFTTGPSDTSKLMTVQFQVESNEDAAYADGDIAVYVYNVTGAALITPRVTSVLDGAYGFVSSFTISSSTSYRLCFHVASTNASAYDVYFDDIAINDMAPVKPGAEPGTATNDSALVGMVGEYIDSSPGVTNCPTSGQNGDLGSISLTAGDWDVYAGVTFKLNGATASGNFNGGISTTSGNSFSGMVESKNWFISAPPTTIGDQSGSVSAYRVSLSATTTHYLKFSCNYSAGTPRALGHISARRVR